MNMKIFFSLSSILLLFFGLCYAEFEDVIRTVDDQAFTDIDISTIEGQSAIALKARNIIGGRPDGSFDGTAPVNRAELAKFLLLAKEINVGNEMNRGKFPDVLEGEWYVKYVIKANKLGILSGYPDGRFEPARNVNTAEFLKMLTETFNLTKNMRYDYLDTSDSDWFGQYAGVAQRYDLFPNRNSSYLEPSRNMTRNEVAVAIWKVLQNVNNTNLLDKPNYTIQNTNNQLSLEQERLKLERERLELEKERLALEKEQRNEELDEQNMEESLEHVRYIEAEYPMVEIFQKECEFDSDKTSQYTKKNENSIYWMCQFEVYFRNKFSQFKLNMNEAYITLPDGNVIRPTRFQGINNNSSFYGKNNQYGDGYIWFEKPPTASFDNIEFTFPVKNVSNEQVSIIDAIPYKKKEIFDKQYFATAAMNKNDIIRMYGNPIQITKEGSVEVLTYYNNRFVFIGGVLAMWK